jgi:hypothetical protein
MTEIFGVTLSKWRVYSVAVKPLMPFSSLQEYSRRTTLASSKSSRRSEIRNSRSRQVPQLNAKSKVRESLLNPPGLSEVAGKSPTKRINLLQMMRRSHRSQ